MPKETLALLDRDTERLLFAGAQVARGDADLEARKQKLAALGAKAPVLAKIAEQVEKAQKAGGKSAAAELLNLSAQMAQVRGMQASPAAAAGDLAALPKAEPLESPLSPTELLSLVGALTVSGKHRPRIVADAVDRGAIRDLRLLPFCVRALGDPAVGYVVQDKLLPSLGHLVVPELQATLRIEKGKELDAKKLRVLAAILGDAFKPKLVAATEKGSPEIRRTAIEELSERDPAMAEPIALRLLAADKSSEVRRAAVEALGGGTSDETLDALMKVFTTTPELRSRAGGSLARLAHPRTTERALALLTPELLNLTNLKLPKADTKAKKEANDKLEKAHREKVSLLSDVLDLLASRQDKLQTAERVLGVFHDHKVKEVKNAAALALLKSGFEKAFDELAPSVYEADWETQERLRRAASSRPTRPTPSTASAASSTPASSRARTTSPSPSASSTPSKATRTTATSLPTTTTRRTTSPRPARRASSRKSRAGRRRPFKLLDHKDLASSRRSDVLFKIKSRQGARCGDRTTPRARSAQDRQRQLAHPPHPRHLQGRARPPAHAPLPRPDAGLLGPALGVPHAARVRRPGGRAGPQGMGGVEEEARQPRQGGAGGDAPAPGAGPGARRGSVSGGAAAMGGVPERVTPHVWDVRHLSRPLRRCHAACGRIGQHRARALRGPVRGLPRPCGAWSSRTVCQAARGPAEGRPPVDPASVAPLTRLRQASAPAQRAAGNENRGPSESGMGVRLWSGPTAAPAAGSQERAHADQEQGAGARSGADADRAAPARRAGGGSSRRARRGSGW